MSLWNWLAGIPVNANLRIKISDLEQQLVQCRATCAEREVQLAALTKDYALQKEQNARLQAQALEHEAEIKRLRGQVHAASAPPGPAAQGVPPVGSGEPFL